MTTGRKNAFKRIEGREIVRARNRNRSSVGENKIYSINKKGQEEVKME